MRGILSIIFTVVLLQINAQGINFQGVARSANGTILASSNISLRLSIISKNVDATPEYIESKTVMTNAQGIFSIVVGDASGTSVTGNFKNILWSDGPKFLKVEMDPSGGTNFINMGATQLQYVPYSFHSFSVDASGIKGILPVEKGGTGVGSLTELKSALNIGSTADTASLSRRIDTKFTKSDILQLENGGTGVKNINDLKTLLNIANPVIQYGSNIGDSFYIKSDVDIFKTFDGGWNRYIFLPAPTNSNNLLANRLNKTILITSGSSFSFTIKKDYTNLNSDIVIKTNEFATFIYNGSKWLLLDGKNAMTNNSTDTLNNTFLGSNSLQVNSTGNGNSAFGDSSLASNTTGQNNTAVGYQTLSSNNTGSWNTAIGLESLKNNTIGLVNTAIGTWSLHDNTQGNGNTAIGANALPLNTTGENNIAIGNTSGSTNTTGSYNILIGSNANVSNSNLTNAIAFGAGATVSNSNSIQLGNTNITGVKTSGLLTAAGFKIPNGTSAQYLRADGTVTTSVTSGVPYTGASQAVDLGAYDLKVNGITAGFGGGQIATNTAFGIGVLNSNTTGSLNAAFGSGVLNMNTTGSSNTGFGIGVLNLNTTGSLNAAFGSGVLYMNTTGSSNSAFGSDALGSNRTGMNNTALGDKALRSNIGNSNSVAIGYKAMFFADDRTTGIPTGNTAIGYESLMGSSTPANNTGIGNSAIGYQSLTNNTTGFNNNALGQISLKNNTTGSRNVAIGSLTLMDNTTGNMNTAIGVDALQYNTTGNMNTGIGYQTLWTNQANIGSVAIGYRAMMNSDNRTTGRITANTAIGYEALKGGASVDNTGQNNTAVGYQSLLSNTSGYSLTAIGESALKSNTTGDRNIAIGSGTLINNTIGKYNIAIGADAMQTNIQGDRNVAVGLKALRLSTGFSNTAIGFYSLEQNNTGQYNTGIGDESLTNNTTGSYNTALGYSAMSLSSTYSNSTAIGYNAQVTASNQIQLGNTSITDVKTSGKLTLGSITFPNTAGTNGYYLKTDGSGTASWAAISGGGIPYTGATQAVDLGNYDLMVNGINIGKGLNNINGNSRFGVNALNANGLSGGQNTAIGGYTLYSNLNGQTNVALGNYSLYKNLSGSSNVALGNYSLYENTSGTSNVAVGIESLTNNTTGAYNTALGLNSMYYNTIGASNTSIGVSSLNSNVNGNYNTAIGVSALASNVSGSNNTAIGNLAMYNNVSYSNSTAIGYNAQVTASNQIQLGDANITDVKTSGAITAKRYVTNVPVSLNFSSGTNQIDLSQGSIISINLSGNVSLTFSNALPGTYILKFIQDATGSRTATFPVSNWKWAGGEVPSLSLSSGKIDIVTIIFDGTTYFATIVNGF